MARYLYKSLTLAQIPAKQPYCLRLRLEDESLFDSVGRSGVIQPLIVTQANEIISGHKRYAAAKSFGIHEFEVLQVDKKLAPQEAFLLAVISHWNQTLTDLEKAFIVSQAVRIFKFSEAEVRAEVLPALGPTEKGFYEEALEVFNLAPEILKAIAEDLIPFRGSRILLRFSPEDQKDWARVCAETALTTNQLLKSGEWLSDLLKLSGLTLQAFLSQNKLAEVLKSKQDRKAKGETFFAQIYGLRFPHVAAREKQFASFAHQLRDEKSNLGVEWPPFFEGQGMTLKAKLKDAQSLEQLLETLQSKRKVLNSLLDLVL